MPRKKQPAVVAPKPTDKRIPHVSKALCTKILRGLFGPTAYLQTTRDASGQVNGLRSVVRVEGEIRSIVTATLKDGESLTADNHRELPWYVLQQSALAIGVAVERAAGPNGTGRVAVRKLMSSGEVAAAEGVPLTDAEKTAAAPPPAPCCPPGCTDGDACSCECHQPPPVSP